MPETFVQNIHGQPRSLRKVVDFYGSDAGRGVLDQARELLDGVQLHSTGMGASYYALLAARQLLDAASPQHVIEESSYLSENSDTLSRPLEATLIVTQSGETVEAKVLVAAEKAKRTLVLTRNVDSTIAVAADLVLPMACDQDLSVAAQTYSSTVSILSLLAARLSDADLDPVLNDILHVADRIEESIARFTADVVAVADRLEGAAQLYAVGRGPSIAAALGTGLLMKEAAKRNCEGSSSAQFRHGAVEVISDETGVIVFTRGEAPTRQLDENLIGELKSYGAPVIGVGPAAANAGSADMFLTIPESSRSLRPILEVLPMQLLAEELARRGGVVAGEFRNTVPVIASA